jgi:hypothetical protein
MDVSDDRVTAESYGALDTTQVTNECWLIRIPQKLAEVWNTVPEGTALGELEFTKGGTVTEAGGRTVAIKPSLSVHVDAHSVAQPPIPSTGTTDPSTTTSLPTSIPLRYSLQAMTKKIPNLHPFTRNPQNGSVELLGTVSRTANLQVEQQDKDYRQQLKDRLMATSINANRFVKPVEATESVIAKQQRSNVATNDQSTTSKKGFGNAVYQYGKRMLEATSETAAATQGGPAKKIRQFAPDQAVRSVVFELFGQQRYWTVKDLKAAAVAGGATDMGSRKAETDLRELLRDIGDYHRSGDHKNMWELRSEFQQQK